MMREWQDCNLQPSYTGSSNSFDRVLSSSTWPSNTYIISVKAPHQVIFFYLLIHVHVLYSTLITSSVVCECIKLTLKIAHCSYVIYKQVSHYTYTYTIIFILTVNWNIDGNFQCTTEGQIVKPCAKLHFLAHISTPHFIGHEVRFL